MKESGLTLSVEQVLQDDWHDTYPAYRPELASYDCMERFLACYRLNYWLINYSPIHYHFSIRQRKTSNIKLRELNFAIGVLSTQPAPVQQPTT